MSDRVAVVIPLYNQGPLVSRAIRSILSQTDPVDEIVVVNDGSTDGGPDEVQAFGDPRIRLLEQSNLGVSAARNLGWGATESDLVCFLDADDEYLPNFVGEVLRLRERFPDCGLYATAYSREVNGVAVPMGALGQGMEMLNGFAQACLHSRVHTCATCVPRPILEEVVGFPEDIALGEDLECWARILLRKPCGYSNAVSAVYHDNPSSVMRSMPLQAGDPPFARAYAEYRERRPDFHDPEFEELVALARLSGFLMGNWMLGRRDAVRTAFRESLRFPRCRKTWLVLRLLTLLPRPLGFILYRFLEGQKGRQVGTEIREPARRKPS
jgi:hypothetical protein